MYNTNGTPHFRLLTDAQMAAVLLEAARYGPPGGRPRWVALMALLCNYGPRIRECLMLRKDQVNFAHGEITFPTIKRRKPTTRTLPLFPQVAASLTVYLATQNGDPRVFPTVNLKSGCTVAWRAFQTMLKRAGIPRTRLHCIRHTVGTKLALMDLATARDWLGHANLSTTNIYVHAVRMREVFAQLKAVV